MSAQPAFIQVCVQGGNVARRKAGKWGYDTEEATRESQVAYGGT
jgi:hypothetical protein